MESTGEGKLGSREQSLSGDMGPGRRGTHVHTLPHSFIPASRVTFMGQSYPFLKLWFKGSSLGDSSYIFLAHLLFLAFRSSISNNASI